MTTAEYFEIGAEHQRGEAGYVMSQSSLKLFADNPDAWIRGRKVETTKSMEWGNLIDVLYLTPEDFGKTYCLFPKVYNCPTKADPHQQKPWSMKAYECQKWATNQRNNGIFPIFRSTYEGAKKAVDALHRHEIASHLRGDCKTQVVCRWSWTDPVTGITVPLKCMIDIAPEEDNYLSDLKSSMDGSLAGFRRTAAKFRYELQGAFYQWGHRECFRDTEQYALIVSESKFPYPVSTFYLTPDDLHVGRYGRVGKWKEIEGFQGMLEKYCRCLDSGIWPDNNGGEMKPLYLYRH
jgi:hypothetical protein